MPRLNYHENCDRCRDLQNLWLLTPTVNRDFTKARQSLVEADLIRAKVTSDALIDWVCLDLIHRIESIPEEAQVAAAAEDVLLAGERLKQQVGREIWTSTTASGLKSVSAACESDEVAGNTHYEIGAMVAGNRLLPRFHHLLATAEFGTTAEERAIVADVEFVIDDADVAAQFQGAIEQLPEPFCSTLKDFAQGKTPSEIATERSVSVETVKSEIKQGILMLASFFRGQ